MKSSDPAPIGDTGSWFRFYKWEAEGETFIPRRTGRHLPVSPGDVLWFLLDDVLVGCVEVLRSTIDPMGRDVQEVWYEPARGKIPNETLTMLIGDGAMSTDELPAELATAWLARCTSRGCGPEGPPPERSDQM
jgi:hypothetical protein